MAMEPALLPPVAGGVLLPNDRSIHPGRALADLIERVDRAGVWLMPFAEVVDVDVIGDRVAGVRTTRGDVDASDFVLAAGAWSGRLAQLLGERVPMLAGRGLSLTVERPDVGPRRPMLLGEDHVAIGPMGDELRLSAWFQLNNFDTAVTAERITRLEAIARRRLRLDDSLVVRRRWAGMRPVTPDGVPIIGPLVAMAQRDHRGRPLDDRSHARPGDRPDRRPARLRRGSRHRHRPLLAEEVLVNEHADAARRAR